MSLKELAAQVGFSPATVSLVINRAPGARSIPQRTKDQIFAAAEKFNYRPNMLARSLRTRQTCTIGVIVPEVSEGYAAGVLSGIEEHLLREDYFYFVAGHHHRADLIEKYAQLFIDRNVDGLIVVDTPWRHTFETPVVSISGNHNAAGVTKVRLDHRLAAELALEHLMSLGHRRIALIKGQSFSSDTEVRWKSILKSAEKLKLEVLPKLCIQLEDPGPTPDAGYWATRDLLASGEPFTALFAFNDISAIGAIRALHEAGLRVPEDVSIVGFDDIQSASYQNPGLTTVRQPLRKMGKTAAEILLQRIRRSGDEEKSSNVVVEPELVVRGTTAPPPAAPARR